MGYDGSEQYARFSRGEVTLTLIWRIFPVMQNGGQEMELLRWTLYLSIWHWVPAGLVLGPSVRCAVKNEGEAVHEGERISDGGRGGDNRNDAGSLPLI